MATPGEKLAESLEELRKLQGRGIVAIKTSMISRVHRERLQNNNYIKEVAKGWYISISPEENEGDSSSWYTSYWKFCAAYLADRYGKSYCISAEQSLQIHAGNWSIPGQLLIRSTEGPNGSTSLPFNTALFSVKSPLPDAAEIIEVEGIRMLTLASALIHSSPNIFKKCMTDAQTALALIRDASDILGLLLAGGHSTKAGQLAGAFRNNGQGEIADNILRAMQKAGYKIREADLFETPPSHAIDIRIVSPYAHRINIMWSDMREVVMESFPKAPGLPTDQEKYLQLVDEIYVTDAYHSLSIEKYSVSAALIERVRSGDWNSTQNEEDRKHKDAMAARGYWQATQKVIESIKKILNNENPGNVVKKDHRDWYLELFAPSVAANILKPADLAGYRNGQVYIGQSRHVPLSVIGVRDSLPVLFELLKQEQEASVRAVLGHFIFVYIHPYMDGNGRMARFLMNVMLASGGFPWTVVPVEERSRYMLALEKSSVNMDIGSFAQYIAYLVNEGLKGTPVATIKKN